jgi:hypothetical protein
MIRRFLIPLLGSGLLLGATAGSALAKCEADPQPAFCSQVVVSVSVAGGGMPQAGTNETLLIEVQQGEEPFMAATSVNLTLVDADGTTVRAPATVTSPGLWTADVTLPGAGSWSVMAEVVASTGDTYKIPVYGEWGELLPVLPADEAPAAAPPATPAAPASPVLPIVLLLSLLAAAAITGQLIRGRMRRRTTEAPVAVRSATTADRA